MAQTKRKRRTKHRGTPAGTISARGRTGRPPSPDERKKQARQEARERRQSTPPTWKSAITRASLMSVLFFIFLLLVTKKNRLPVAAGLAVVSFFIYVPAGYYIDRATFRYRQRKKAQGRAK
jgi:hypothetical protein